MTCFTGGGFSFPLGVRTYIMGILNFTPDSFSDGGEYFSVQSAVERAKEMELSGADIIDFGACSTAPGRERANGQMEFERVERCLPVLVKELSVPVSIDTCRVSVARFALENGAKIVNDESGLFTREMASAVRDYGAGWIFMHTGGESADSTAAYNNGVVSAVRESFLDFVEKAESFGIKRSSLCVDMGIGFGKTHEDNIELIKSAGCLKIPDVALLTGLSRKRVIGYLTGDTKAKDRDAGTLAANTVAIAGKTDIIRVHDVKSALAAARTADGLLRNASRDEIIVKDLELYAYHGVNPEEKENGQRFILDITAAADLKAACLADNIDLTVSYAKIIKTASAVFTAQKDDLIERAAQRVADALLNEYNIDTVTVTVKKPDAPISARFGCVAVKIERKRQ